MTAHFAFAASKVIPVFLMVGIGMLLRWLKLIDAGLADVIIRLCFLIFIPANIISNITTYDIDLRQAIKPAILLYVVIIGYIVLVWAGVKAAGLSRSVSAVIIQSSFRGNVLLLGLPIAFNMYGAENAIPSIVVLVAGIPLYNMASVIILDIFDENTDKVNYLSIVIKILKNPLIIAVFIGIVFKLIHLQEINCVNVSLGMLSSLATPLSLIALGASLNMKKIKSNVGYLICITCLKLIILPAIGITAAVLLGFNQYEVLAILISLGVPTGIVSYIMASEKGMSPDLAGESVITTTLASVVTMTLIISTLSAFGIL